MLELIIALFPGLSKSLSLTFFALFIGLLLSLFFTFILSFKIKFISFFILGYITIFTGTPLLVQFFLIYYGPNQFSFLQSSNTLWFLISSPWMCAMISLSLNSAAYCTLLFNGALKEIDNTIWQSCQALGLSHYQSLKIILPYVFKRIILSYGNEVILVFKSTGLASTITVLEIMGYSQQIFSQTYNIDVFIAAGIIYLFFNNMFAFLINRFSKYMLSFEKTSYKKDLY
ncbi:arginine ABC transporter permease ArtM [Arsenophonus symbiont of Ornithomya chloropus]|uniref:arginine ABC transporter permease ArtM n=1 Tax=Arsenophonus symbiont of Ornithomya chloropus TaxID=634121 RepID=UPI0032B2273E